MAKSFIFLLFSIETLIICLFFYCFFFFNAKFKNISSVQTSSYNEWSLTFSKGIRNIFCLLNFVTWIFGIHECCHSFFPRLITNWIFQEILLSFVKSKQTLYMIKKTYRSLQWIRRYVLYVKIYFVVVTWI